MINYPCLRTSTDFEFIGEERLTDNIKNKLKLTVFITESLFDEFETLDCGFLLLPIEHELKTNDYIYLAITFDDEYEDETIDSGMGCLVYVSECFSLNGPDLKKMQIVSIGYSNLL